MPKRILESKDAVISTLAIISAPVDALSQEEWEVPQETCTVLELFEQVTVEISTESHSKQLLLYCLLLCNGILRIILDANVSNNKQE